MSTDKTQSNEDYELIIKQLLLDKVIYRKENTFIFDFKAISSENIDFIDYFLLHPMDSYNLLKYTIGDLFGRGFNIKFINVTIDEEISDLRVSKIGKLVKIKGILSNATDILVLSKSRSYECKTCGSIFTTEGKVPTRCSCKGKDFIHLKEKDLDIDMQEITLEENPDEIGDRNPKKTRVRLLDELCNKNISHIINNGNKIEVIGIVQKVPIQKDNKTEDEISYFRIFALQVTSLEDEFNEDISEEDLVNILEISADNPLKRLADSLAPKIIGEDLIKKSLVLGMVGGNAKKTRNLQEDKEFINIMLVGDASKGKSILLKACKEKHFKGKYVTCDTKPSIAGITAAAEKDELTGAWQLKIGVYPKSDSGLVCLDEFDKADKVVQSSLHSVLESGIVTIHKASIDATLQARCTTFIGANPENSRFDPKKPLVQQISLPPTMLSRFDLIWVMRDLLDEKEDRRIISHKFKEVQEVNAEIDTNLFKKYLKYCQKIKPKMTEEVQDIIGEFYIKIRKQAYNSSGLVGMPIVPRQLNALIRLSEASAKVRLSEIVEKEDAEIAIKLFKESLYKLGLDSENNLFDLARITGGKTVSKAQKETMIFNRLKELTKGGAGVPNNDFKNLIINETNMDANDYYDIMDSLSRQALVAKTIQGWKVVPM